MDISNENKGNKKLTRKELKALETKDKTKFQKAMDVVISILPLVCGLIALAEYIFVPNGIKNEKPNTYIGAILVFMAAFVVLLVVNRLKARYKAPLYSALFLLLALYDFLTLKTGILTQPFIPCMNSILNIAWQDRGYLIECTLATLKLLFLGYFIGVAVGLLTGISCGYSKRMRYWVQPIINFMGPIPIATWVPIVMVIAASLFQGATCIIALGSWFSVTVSSMTGIANVSQDFYDAARTLGASNRQLVFRVAIPHAMPEILGGCTTGMSAACTALIIAEMMGVKAGLGWYMTWARAWSSYDKMFAALFIICIIFTIVNRTLAAVKKYVLRWKADEV